MARSKNNPILAGFHGKLGNLLVIIQYSLALFYPIYPDMSEVKPSPLLVSKREKFKAAVIYANPSWMTPLK